MRNTEGAFLFKITGEWFKLSDADLSFSIPWPTI